MAELMAVLSGDTKTTGSKEEEDALEDALAAMIAEGGAQASLLPAICRLLNNAPHAPQLAELRRLIDIWQRSGPNTRAMFEAESGLHERLEGRLHPVLVPTGTGNVYLHFQSENHLGGGGEIGAQAWVDVCLTFFTTLIVSPEWQRFGGPCPQCKRYFIRKTAKKSIYCSQHCASRATAQEATTRAREAAHQDKLARAEQAKTKWERLSKERRSKTTWKEWIATAQPGITVRFLTRAVNSGELSAPKTA